MGHALPGSPRLNWAELPAHVRQGVSDIVGGTVEAALPRTGGFSPGSADVLMASTGRRECVKAVSDEQNPDTPGLLRREYGVLLDLAHSERPDLFPRPLGL